MTSKVLTATLVFFIMVSLAAQAAAQDTGKVDYIINWEPSPEPYVTDYVIYRSSIPDVNSATEIATVLASVHTYVDAQLDKGSRYYYYVKAKNSSTDEMSAFSNPVSGYTISQSADASTKAQCAITGIIKTANGSYNVSWSSTANSIGFVQYDLDFAALDSMSAWDDDQYSMLHENAVTKLLAPNMYYLRAVSYDDQNNMIISAIDSLLVTNDVPQPLTAPELAIYPVPYHPGMGVLHLTNLPEGGSVTVYAASGNEVWHQEVGSDPLIDWDGSNQQGSKVMSGVYYVVTKDSTGTIVDKRPIMIVH